MITVLQNDVDTDVRDAAADALAAIAEKTVDDSKHRPDSVSPEFVKAIGAALRAAKGG